jgi:CRP-like cAMP-binding protein
MGPRDVVGGLGALIGDPLGQHAVAVKETLTLKLDREDMEDVFEDNFRIFLGVLRALARSLVGLEQQLGRDVGPRPQHELTFADGRKLGLVERILLLRGSMHFVGAEIEALADLAEECEEIELSGESVLWQVGDVAEHAILLVSGRIRARAADHDPFWFEPGDVIGGVDALCGEARWYSALAEGRVRGLQIETQRLLDVIEDNMGVGMNLLRIIARGIREVSERVPA